MAWMDTLRGSAIVLVIMWHSAAILILNGLAVPRWLVLFNESMAPYRMPVLMFLSGMLLNRALDKPIGTYYAGKLRHIAWPWFVWSVVNILVMSPAAGPLAIPTWFFSYLWFLAFIMAYYMIAPAIRWVPAPLVATGFAILSFPVSDDVNRRKFCFLAVFFFVGKWASENDHVLAKVTASRWIWSLAPLSVAFGLISGVFGPWRYYVVLVPLSILGIAVSIKAAQAFTGRNSRGIEFVGRNSLIYYVTHFPLIVIFVRAGSSMGLGASVLVPGSLMLALVAGTVAARLAMTTPVRWLFEIPRGALTPNGPPERLA